MKHLTILTLLALTLTATAQTNGFVSVDAGTQVTADTRNFSIGVNIGIKNWNNDFGSLGFVTKTYGNKTICAGRMSGLIMLNSWFATYLTSDIFVIKDGPPIYKRIQGEKINVQYNTSRLEVGTGIGVKYKSLLLLAGIQSDDYDPIADNRKQAMITSRLTYLLDFAEPKDRRKHYRRRIGPGRD